MTTHVRADGKPLANISRYHPDYGMTPSEHEAQKVKRAAGKVKFVPKAEVRAKHFKKTRR